MTIERPVLEPDERLIWSGQPNALRYALKKGLVTCLFGVLWTIGTAVGLKVALGRGDPIGTLVASGFVLIGLSFLFSPLWLFWRALHTSYVLTHKRATTSPIARRLSVPLNPVQFTDLQQSSGGVGDIYFKEVAVSGGEGPALSREGFIAVADAAEVERILRRALEKAPQ